MKFLRTAIATVSLAASAWSQTGDIRVVTEYRIKVDRGPEFTDLQNKFAAELKKAAGPRARYVFQLLSGPRAYLVVSYYGKGAEMDSPPAATAATAALLARINACVESSERRVDLIDRSLSIRDTEAMPNMIQVVRVSVRPEKVDEYL